MCLYTEWKKPKKAEKDIVVYKVLLINNISPYQRFAYELGIEYKEPMRKESSTYGEGLFIDKGFHAYVSTKALKMHGLLVWFRGSRAFKCIIPKGSNYYISSDKLEIVSDSIIIKRKLLFNRF